MTRKKEVISGWGWHCHHEILYELVSDYKERVSYIKKYKPRDEQELRLRLFKMIPDDRLPREMLGARATYYKAKVAYNETKVAYAKAWLAFDKAEVVHYKVKAAYNKSRVAYYKAETAYNESWAAYNEAAAACGSYFAELHKELCPRCPWDGETIFPEETK